MDTKTLSSLFHDLHKIFVLLRHLAADNQYNSNVIRLLQFVEEAVVNIRDKHTYDRAAFVQCMLQEMSSESQMSEIFEESLRGSTHHELADNDVETMKYLSVMVEVVQEARKQLAEGNNERTYDLLDCVHNLPTLLYEKGKRNRAAFWKHSVKYYRLKWHDRHFLSKEEQRLAPPSLLRKWFAR